MKLLNSLHKNGELDVLRASDKLGRLMADLSVIDLLSDKNTDMEKRLLYNPPMCSIFDNKFVTLETMRRFKFKVDLSSEKQLYKIINNDVQRLVQAKTISVDNKRNLTRKLKIGIVFSGGPAPGGHNVISGLYDALKKSNTESSLFGFIMGPEGVMEGNYIKLTDDLVNRYRNSGGFGMIKTGRTKIDTDSKLKLSSRTCKELSLDAIVIVGGDDSNTNAAFLAQKMFDENISVIGVPKTIDGDIQVKDLNGEILCATSFGFDTAARSFSYLISNLCIDAVSTSKYWHICKVMGRVASHLALEIAFQTHVNLTLIGEELADCVDHCRIGISKADGDIDYTAYGITLSQLVNSICKSITERARVGKNFGVIVIPEGILEFINEIQVFITKLSTIIANFNFKNNKSFHDSFSSLDKKIKYLDSLLTPGNDSQSCLLWNINDSNVFGKMPILLQKGLLTERDSHGNFQFSQVKTEEIILCLIEKELESLAKQGKYSIGIKKRYCNKILGEEGLNKHIYTDVLFADWDTNEYLVFNNEITSKDSLKRVLVEAKLLNNGDSVPKSIYRLFEKTIPKFKAQTHFYGYDGRGNVPSNFDCTYAYNLGQTAFHLINNNATGQMASILNLDDDIDCWQPIGIPIARLMHLEERNSKLALVLEKSIVDLESPAFLLFKELRKKWLGANKGVERYKIANSVHLTNDNAKPITMTINKVSKNKMIRFG